MENTLSFETSEKFIILHGVAMQKVIIWFRFGHYIFHSTALFILLGTLSSSTPDSVGNLPKASAETVPPAKTPVL
jgi:hypothetical protein